MKKTTRKTTIEEFEGGKLIKRTIEETVEETDIPINTFPSNPYTSKPGIRYFKDTAHPALFQEKPNFNK